MTDVDVWSKTSSEDLVSQVLTVIDKGSKTIARRRFPWNEISVAGRTPDDCKEHYNRLRQSALRDLRFHDEVALVQDWVKNKYVSTNFERPPKRPQTSFFAFLERKRNHYRKKYPDLTAIQMTTKLGEIWKNLSVEKKEKYEEIARHSKLEYAEKLSKYKEDHPSTSSLKNRTADVLSQLPVQPKSAFQLYYESKAENYAESDKTEEQIKKKLLKKWKKLADEGQKKWLNLATEQEPNFIAAVKEFKESHPLLSVRVPQVGEIASGTVDDVVLSPPHKPPNNTYSYFARDCWKEGDLLNNNGDFVSASRLVAERYKNLPEDEKRSLSDRWKAEMEEFKKKAQIYVENISDPVAQVKAQVEYGLMNKNKRKNPKPLLKVAMKKRRGSGSPLNGSLDGENSLLSFSANGSPSTSTGKQLQITQFTKKNGPLKNNST